MVNNSHLTNQTNLSSSLKQSTTNGTGIDSGRNNASNKILVVFVVVLAMVCVVQLFITIGSIYVIYKTRYSKSFTMRPFRSSKISSARVFVPNSCGQIDTFENGSVSSSSVEPKVQLMGSGFVPRPLMDRLTPEFLREN